MTDIMKKPRYWLIASTLPAVILTIAAAVLHTVEQRSERSKLMAEQARLSAAAVDFRLERLLNLANFCATSPAIIARMDLVTFRESCGRYAEMLDAWVVVVTLGETHQQLINTLPAASTVLPSYPRTDEIDTLLDIEARSKLSGRAEIANVFTGRIYTGGIISAGQWLRLSDGREAMLYVSTSARSLSRRLAELAEGSDTIFGLVDPSDRIVARSSGIEALMFSPAPSWFLDELAAELPGSNLGMPGPQDLGGTWDVGYYPLYSSRGWMAIAVQPAPRGFTLWGLFSFENTLLFYGLAFSAVLLGINSYRQRTEEKLRASTQAQIEAEKQVREKSRLLASFAHDVRSPLVSMIGTLALMEESKATEPAAVQTARTSAEALLQLVDDILELSFLGSGQMVLHPSPVDLRRLINDLAAQARITAQQKAINITVEVDQRVPSTVELDRLRLQQVLGNLLTNAVKYSEKGNVTVQVMCGKEHNGVFDLTFAVKDTGVGISKDQESTVFREFGRLDRPIERREPGTGLGLAICKRILRSMGTALHLESAVGEGSIFSFHLPVRALPEAELASDAMPLTNVTILYAEDEAIIRKVTSRQLTEAGATVIEAKDGAEALEILRTLSPDLLLIDIQMPGLNGVETIQRLKKSSHKRSYPIFVLTSHISGPQVAEARIAGADEVFTKPVQILPLAAALTARRGDRGTHTPNIGGSPLDKQILIDLERLQSFVSTQRRAFLDEYLPDFETRMHDDVKLLTKHISDGDLPAAQTLAHRCLGICLVLGATALGTRLQAIEDEAAIGDKEDVELLAEGLQDLVEETALSMRDFAANVVTPDNSSV